MDESSSTELKVIEDAASRIYARVELDPTTGCLVWPGLKTEKGYGMIRVRGCESKHYVHRIVLSHAMGYALAPTEEVHHGCFNRACVNVEHLQVLSTAEHNRLHGRRGCGESNPFWKSHCIRGHALHGPEADLTARGDCRPCSMARHIAMTPERRAQRRAYLRTYDAHRTRTEEQQAARRERNREAMRARRAALKTSKECA